jgi:hypothetical protein
LLHDDDEGIFWFLFLLLLFCKEAGNAFVENKVRTTKNQHKESRPEQAGIFVFRHLPQPPSEGGGFRVRRLQSHLMIEEK